MAHFAKLGVGNKIITVTVVHNDVAPTEQAGIDFLNNLYNTRDIWKQTFKDGTRKNNAAIGYTYDQTRDAFIPPKHYRSWTLNETTCQWEAPSAKPDDGKSYSWNESTKSWEEVVL